MNRRRNNMFNSRNFSVLPRSVPALMASGAGLVVIVMGLPAFAQSASQATQGNDPIEEIIVTAQKTGAQSIQQTPLAMSAFSADDMTRTLSNNIKDLSAY